MPEADRSWGSGLRLHLTALLAIKNAIFPKDCKIAAKYQHSELFKGSFSSTAKFLKAVLAAQRFVKCSFSSTAKYLKAVLTAQRFF